MFESWKFIADIDDPLGDLLLSDDEIPKPKSNKTLTTGVSTNVTSRPTDNKDPIKDKSSLMDSLFGNHNSSSKSDEKLTTQNPSKPLGGSSSVVGTKEMKKNEIERYVTSVTWV